MEVVASMLLLLLLLLILPFQIRSQANHSDPFTCELEEMKLKLTRLESTLSQTTQTINARTSRVEELEMLIKDMENKIQYLKSALLSIKGNLPNVDGRLNALEEEVQALWAASRKNNFDLHVLHSKVEDAKDRVYVVTSQVEKMADIVTEQWIQIQQLEQALQFTEVRAMEIRVQVGDRCTFLKFVNAMSSKHLPGCRVFDEYQVGKESTMSSFLSRTLQLFSRLFSAVRKHHHELQGMIRLEMERNKFVAALANEEVIFVVASAIITFPILGAWMLLSSKLA